MVSPSARWWCPPPWKPLTWIRLRTVTQLFILIFPIFVFHACIYSRLLSLNPKQFPLTKSVDKHDLYDINLLIFRYKMNVLLLKFENRCSQHNRILGTIRGLGDNNVSSRLLKVGSCVQRSGNHLCDVCDVCENVQCMHVNCSAKKHITYNYPVIMFSVILLCARFLWNIGLIGWSIGWTFRNCWSLETVLQMSLKSG